MNETLVLVSSFSLVFAAVIGWIRFKKINPAYYPFLLCLWIGLVNEIISFIVIRNGKSNALNSNIYVLVESVLITWQFKKWGIFERHKNIFYLLILIFLLVWITENFIVSKINYFSSYFRIVYSSALTLLSINQLNALLIREKKNILNNSVFLICVGFVLYYTYKVLVEAFWLYGLNNSRDFRNNIYLILAYINLVANLIYAVAVLWMPTKHRFSLPS